MTQEKELTAKETNSNRPSVLASSLQALESPIQEQTVAEQEMSMDCSPNQPSTRLLIQKIVLNNFKSYAGRVEIGPFHKVNILTL